MPEMRRKQPGRKPLRSRKRSRRYLRRRFRINSRRFLPTILLIAVFLYAAVNLVQYGIRSAETRRTNALLQEMLTEATEAPPAETAAPVPVEASTPQPELLDSYQYIGDAILSDVQELYWANPDLVAWLRIPGVVNLPVVYRDNIYYLDHDFNGKRSSSGTLFLDEAHPLAEDTQYLVVHGHNMYDGTMFGLLSGYRKRGYMEEHPTVYLNTLYRKETYEVIGVLNIPDDAQSDGYVRYTGIRKFKSLTQFEGFAQSIRENALYWKEGTEMRPDDALLALSTCYQDDRRIVVMCRRTSP